MPDIKARIFPAANRPGIQTPYVLQFQTVLDGIAFGGSPSDGGLQKISDDTLRAGIERLVECEADSTVVLIPYVGDLELTDQTLTTRMLPEGEVFAWSVRKGETYAIKNPYQEEAINFFQITFLDIFPETAKSRPNLTRPIVMDEWPDELLPIYERDSVISIGKYQGRSEGTYRPGKTASGIFAFVVEGAFEVQNRLLEKRDGLALWNAEEIEFEALSEGAVLLLVEV